MWALIVAAASPLVVAVGFWYTQRRTDKRDLAKWRNEQLLASVSALLRLSTSRQSELIDWYEDWIYHRDGPTRTGGTSEKVWEMELLVAQIRLLDNRSAQAAEAIYRSHKAAQDRAADANPAEPVSPEDEIEALMADGLEDLHTALVDAFQSVTGVQ